MGNSGYIKTIVEWDNRHFQDQDHISPGVIFPKSCETSSGSKFYVDPAHIQMDKWICSNPGPKSAGPGKGPSYGGQLWFMVPSHLEMFFDFFTY